MQPDIDVMKVADSYLDKAKKLLARDGCLEPVAFLLLPNGEKEIVALGQFQGDRDKAAKFRMLHERAEQSDADVLIEICDAYFRDYRENPQELIDRLQHGGPPLRQDPKAHEAIFMMVCVREGGSEMVTVPYTRCPEGKIVFAAPKYASREFPAADLEHLGLVVPRWITPRHKGHPFRGQA